MRLVFCLFADSVELIPNHAFRNLIKNDRFLPSRFNRKLPDLLEAMSSPEGFFGADDIPWFNGDLFKPHDHMIVLNKADLGILHSAAQHDWSHIEPSIFGTLFERSLDAAKRSLIGAHYTSPEDILLLVEPVVMQPLRRRWAAVQQAVLAALAEENASSVAEELGGPSFPASSERVGSGLAEEPGAPPSARLHRGRVGSGPARKLASKLRQLSPDATAVLSANGAPLYQPGAQPQVAPHERPQGLKARPIDAALRAERPPKRSATQSSLKLNRPALDILQNWAAELSSVRVLDPACGSGNFLYITLKRLLDLWHETRVFALHHGLTLAVDPMPSPAQLFGIETDFYAHEIASIVVWIGFLQWKHDHGVEDHKTPLLRKLTNIEHGDAIMRYDADGKPYEPEWPEVDYIVGNPPFLGGNRLRAELGDDYADNLFSLYAERIPRFADLVCYWFERARLEIESGKCVRAGLIATQGIRGGVNRHVLVRIKETGNIFFALSDREWPLDGAMVHISLVAFDRGEETDIRLDEAPVSEIYPNLTSGLDTTTAEQLAENRNICFMGPSPKAPFDIDSVTATVLTHRPLNVNHRPNSDVIVPVVSAIDLMKRNRGMWTIDFGTMRLEEAAMYEAPFEYVRHKVKPAREADSRPEYARVWWQYGRPRVEMRRALHGLSRFIATPAVSKHRVFVWLAPPVISNQGTLVFARSDDYFFGIVQSRHHELWARSQGTQLREAESGFRYTPTTTFETFPFPWPPGKEPSENDARVEVIASAARDLVAKRDAWLNPPDISESDLKKRTLTNLYNERPTWLSNLHRALDQAVFAAYGWPSTLTDTQILERLLALNHERAAKQ